MNELFLLKRGKENLPSAPAQRIKKCLNKYFTKKPSSDHWQIIPKFNPYLESFRRRGSYLSGADIALIKVSNHNIETSKVCFILPKSFGCFNYIFMLYEHYIYNAECGLKGLIGSENLTHAYLTWIPMRNKNTIAIYHQNFTFDNPPLGDRLDENLYFEVSNDDIYDGHFITSATCPGDSGSPVFAYGKQSIGQIYAIQVGVLRGVPGYVSMSIFLNVYILYLYFMSIFYCTVFPP